MLKKPYHNRKRKEPRVHVSTKVVKPIIGVITQTIKPTRVLWDILVLFILALKIVHLTVLKS
jgi:hypothetical protein